MQLRALEPGVRPPVRVIINTTEVAGAGETLLTNTNTTPIGDIIVLKGVCPIMSNAMWITMLSPRH